MKLLVLVSCMVTVVAVVAVSQDRPQLAEGEYTWWCSTLEFGEPLAREADTWEWAMRWIGATLREAEAIAPPDSLRTFHNAFVDVTRAGLDVPESEWASEAISADERVAERVNDLISAYGELPHHLQESLESTGCLVVA